jgi:hypothetical protein
LVPSFIYGEKYVFVHNAAIGVYNNFSFCKAQRRGSIMSTGFSNLLYKLLSGKFRGYKEDS